MAGGNFYNMNQAREKGQSLKVEKEGAEQTNYSKGEIKYIRTLVRTLVRRVQEVWEKNSSVASIDDRAEINETFNTLDPLLKEYDLSDDKEVKLEDYFSSDPQLIEELEKVSKKYAPLKENNMSDRLYRELLKIEKQYTTTKDRHPFINKIKEFLASIVALFKDLRNPQKKKRAEAATEEIEQMGRDQANRPLSELATPEEFLREAKPSRAAYTEVREERRQVSTTKLPVGVEFEKSSINKNPALGEAAAIQQPIAAKNSVTEGLPLASEVLKKVTAPPNQSSEAIASPIKTNVVPGLTPEEEKKKRPWAGLGETPLPKKPPVPPKPLDLSKRDVPDILPPPTVPPQELPPIPSPPTPPLPPPVQSESRGAFGKLEPGQAESFSGIVTASPASLKEVLPAPTTIVNSGELDARSKGATSIYNRQALSDDVTNFSSINYTSPIPPAPPPPPPVISGEVDAIANPANNKALLKKITEIKLNRAPAGRVSPVPGITGDLIEELQKLQSKKGEIEGKAGKSADSSIFGSTAQWNALKKEEEDRHAKLKVLHEQIDQVNLSADKKAAEEAKAAKKSEPVPPPIIRVEGIPVAPPLPVDGKLPALIGRAAQSPTEKAPLLPNVNGLRGVPEDKKEAMVVYAGVMDELNKKLAERENNVQKINERSNNNNKDHSPSR
ncbi:hypothetical protein [Candidatus Tisiphia endosymbiont of Beris chalybata]|uniref:hypothetical protein n=1 Tax=Candidatus Tisiphia endosymbiont of Beris chalybata TaxID=3066262 RepID=UPI00312C7C68